AEARAVCATEDLVRQRERNGVAAPGGDVELVVLHVRRAQLLRLGVGRLILPRRDRHVEYRIGEAAVARSVQTSVEPQLEDRARAGTSDRQLRRDGLGNGQVALPAELERLGRA